MPRLHLVRQVSDKPDDTSRLALEVVKEVDDHGALGGIDEVACSELPLRVAAPAVQRVTIIRSAQCAGKIVTRGDLLKLGFGQHGNRHNAVLVRRTAQLAGSVVPPAANGAVITAERAGVVAATEKAFNVGQRRQLVKRELPTGINARIDLAKRIITPT